MNNCVFFIGTDTPALKYTQSFLEANGCKIAPAPSDNVTHLILNVPTFTPDGNLAGGGNLNEILGTLPKDISIIGGKLNAPVLQDYTTWDLLQNEAYLAENAAITAECALQIALSHSPSIIRGTPILITGWGRIAKCLAKLLGSLAADVTVTARKEADIALAGALGYSAIPLKRVSPELPKFRIIFNTIPAMILPAAPNVRYHQNCIKIDLASAPGMAGSDVITARGLPSKMAPETTGHLIAKTILGLPIHKEVSI